MKLTNFWVIDISVPKQYIISIEQVFEPVLNVEAGGCFKSQYPVEFLEGLAVSTT